MIALNVNRLAQVFLVFSIGNQLRIAFFWSTRRTWKVALRHLAVRVTKL